MTNNVYNNILKCKNDHSKKFAVLIDPDNVNSSMIDQIISNSVDAKVDYFFVGGSLVLDDNLDYCLETIKKTVRHSGDIVSRKQFTN